MRRRLLVALLIFLFSPALFCLGQRITDEDLIAKSQTKSSPVFFNFSSNDVSLVSPGNFYDENECVVRGGINNFFSSVKTKKQVRIAYLGGSISNAPKMYRNQSAKFIQTMFPDVKIEGINAGVSGTDADLGACRLQEQVLKYKPDLLFIEFAVNGGFARGIEGIIRQTRKLSPQTAICLLYAVKSNQLKAYQSGLIPDTIRLMEEVANYYGIPSIHLAKEPASLASQHKLLERSDLKSTEELIVFSKDGVHPLEAGGNLYASAIARALIKLQKPHSVIPVANPQPLYKNNWENAQMLAPLEVASFSKGWESINIAESGLKDFKAWFPYVMTAEKQSSSMSFKFEGDMFGFFDIGGPEVGMLDLLIDGKSVKLRKDGAGIFYVVPGEGEQLNRFNTYCNNRYRGQYICIELPLGKHEVSLAISDKIPDKKEILGSKQLADINQNPDKYARSIIYIGKILINGKIIK